MSSVVTSRQRPHTDAPALFTPGVETAELADRALRNALDVGFDADVGFHINCLAAELPNVACEISQRMTAAGHQHQTRPGFSRGACGG